MTLPELSDGGVVARYVLILLEVFLGGKFVLYLPEICLDAVN